MVSDLSVLADLARRDLASKTLGGDSRQQARTEIDSRVRRFQALEPLANMHPWLEWSDRTEVVEIMLAHFWAGLNVTPFKTYWCATKIVCVLYSAGSSEIQRNIIARQIGLGGQPS